MQVITAPEERRELKGYSRDVFIFGAGYHIPLYGLGDSIDLSVGYSNVNSGVVQNIYNVSGAGTTYGVRYNLNLPRIGDYEHKLIGAIDHREFNNKVTTLTNPGTGSLIPDVTVNPASATYTASFRKASYEWSFYTGLHMNIPSANGDGSGTAFAATRSNTVQVPVRNAPVSYKLLRFGGNYGYAFSNDWQLRGSFAGQWTEQMLVPGEQFGIGGADAVRGYAERQFSSDKGIRASLEVYSPDFGTAFPIEGLKVRALVFRDGGQLARILPNNSEVERTRISSLGYGIRVTKGTSFALRLDVAFASRPHEIYYGNTPPAALTNQYRQTRIHGTLSYSF